MTVYEKMDQDVDAIGKKIDSAYEDIDQYDRSIETLNQDIRRIKNTIAEAELSKVCAIDRTVELIKTQVVLMKKRDGLFRASASKK